jgi:hypothetical protein
LTKEWRRVTGKWRQAKSGPASRYTATRLGAGLPRKGKHSMNIYKPYTYLIGWTLHQKYYYGVRYKPGCHPEDFWKSYFTSSKKVKECRELWGDPDIIQIRKTFNTGKDAINWEFKVLKKLHVRSNDKWLNMAIGKPTSKGSKHTEEHKAYMKLIMTGRDAYWLKGKKRSDHSKCISNKKWITNGVEDKYINKDELIPEGYIKGRKPYSKEWKSKLGGDRRSKLYSSGLVEDVQPDLHIY